MQATMYLQQVNPVKRHAAQVPIKHIQVKHPVMLPMQATMFPAQLKPVKRPVKLERSAVVKDQFRVRTLLQDTMCHLLASRSQQHAMQVPIKHHLVKHPVMPLISAHMFQLLGNQRKLHVQMEHQPLQQEVILQSNVFPISITMLLWISMILMMIMTSFRISKSR